ncbi:hypothetical protein ACSBM8_10570 [Sphingomonas sp. ASY06-1R]|jgi:hypothetical protein
MRLTDIVIMLICGLLGYGIVRNLLGPSPRSRDETQTDSKADEADD